MVTREQTQQNYDRLSRWYDLFAGSEKKFTQAGLQVLNVKTGEHLLEIGFGTGHALTTIAQQVGESGLAAGVELSAGMIAVTKQRSWVQGSKRRAQMVQGDGTRLPFAPNSYDAVFLSFTLELFSDIEIPVLLRECQRVLKSDGRLGVVSLAKQHTLACCLYEWGHERWPTLLDCRPIQLKEKLETGGFRIQASNSMTMWGLPVEIVVGSGST